ncbi:MAG: EamA family transporter [Desulfobacterales bacterium]|nr:MAG: EamA family transporter [Desulfobacterales bacterium]
MSITAAILLIISAVTHAGWNFISKREHPTQAFYLVANTIGVICVLPILFYHWPQVHLIPQPVWIFAVMSGFFLAAYLEALAGSYRSGDISIAYPLARALPVIFVFCFTLFLGKGKPLGGWFILGAVLVVGGCIILPLKTLREFHIFNYKNPCCFLAVLAALGISGYTVTDDNALRHLRELPVNPFDPLEGTLIYMVLEGISCSLWQSLFVLLQSRERADFSKVLHKYKGAATTTGIGIYLTYGLVLVSMNFVTNVSYVAAFRQLSIPLGALFGMVLLKEPRYNPKIIGVTMIFIGLISVGLG